MAEHALHLELTVPAGISGLIFDCDGTLADTLPLHYRAWEEGFAALGLACPQPFLVRHNGKPTELAVQLGCVLRIPNRFGHDDYWHRQLVPAVLRKALFLD